MVSRGNCRVFFLVRMIASRTSSRGSGLRLKQESSFFSRSNKKESRFFFNAWRSKERSACRWPDHSLPLILTFPTSNFFIRNQKRYSTTMPHRQATQTAISSSLLYSSCGRSPSAIDSEERANDVVVQVQLLQPRLEQSSR